LKIINIIGMGGHTRSTINLLTNSYPDAKIYIYDDNFNLDNSESVFGYKLVGKILDLTPDKNIIISIGDNKKREELFYYFGEDIVSENLFHQKSFIEEKVTFGKSNQIFANTYINNYSKIGNNNIINSGAIIEHECNIGSHNHVSIGAIMCGRSSVGDNCYLGAGSILIDKVSVCDNVIIGAGCVVKSDILESGTYVGVPARRVK
jgi:UDP-N-acetylbacillosamine N-acetyltransferase